jgi:hypothetical protein
MSGTVVAGAAIAAGRDPAPVEIPPQFQVRDREGALVKDARNAFTGDSRIRVRRFHGILFFDTKAFPESAENDREQLRNILASFSQNLRKEAGQTKAGPPFLLGFDVAPGQVDLTTEADTTWARLDKELGKLGKVDPNDPAAVQQGDVVFFWANVHGNPDGTLQFRSGEPEGGFVNIPRDELREKLEFPIGGQRRTYLTVFITDDCGRRFDVGATKQVPSGYTEEQLPKIWRSLYYGYRFTADISSSDVNQKAFSRGSMSIFMQAFRDAFNAQLNPKDVIDKDGDEFVDWETEFFKRLSTETNKIAQGEIKKYVQGPDASGKRVLTAKGKTLPPDQRLLILEWAEQGGQTPKLFDPKPIRNGAQ